MGYFPVEIYERKMFIRLATAQIENATNLLLSLSVRKVCLAKLQL